MKRPYTIRNVVPLPHQQQEGPHIVGATRTLEEAIATVREAVDEGHSWLWYEITTNGLRWWWEPNGRNHIMKSAKVDTSSVP